MREYTTPPGPLARPSGNLTDDPVRNAAEHPERVCFAERDETGWREMTAAGFLADVRSVAKGLLSLGVTPGDRVLLGGRTCYAWTVCDYAVWFAGGVVVPVYPTAGSAQVAHVAGHAGAVAAVLETAAHRQGVVTDPGLRAAAVLDLSDALDHLGALGAQVADVDLDRVRSATSPEDAASIIYTSGTTGPPRGCTLTHANLMHEVSASTEELSELFEGEDASTLLFLPLPHVFARIIQIGAVRARVRLAYCPDPRRLPADLLEVQPTFLLAVPRVVENVFNTASQRAAADGWGRRFDRGVQTAIELSQAREEGRRHLALRVRRLLHERRTYRRLRALLGGSCRYVISGGAPLGQRLGHFFRGIGVTVLEGYGLAETSGAVTVNRVEAQRIGSVGQPLPGTGVRVAEDGELLVRGSQVMSGYWRDDGASTEAIDAAGWLRTGDLGEIDDQGFVRVIGRKTEVLVTAGGKHVAPAPLEDQIRAHPLVSQCLVVGDGRPFVAALLSLDLDATHGFARQRALPRDLEALVDHPDLLAAVQEAVDAANSTVSQAESIRRFVVVVEQWDEEGGYLTPSLKLRRDLVERTFHADVERLYDV